MHLKVIDGSQYLLLKNSAFNPLDAKLNPICHLLTLLGTRPILHVSRIRVKIQHLQYICNYSD